MDGGRGGRGVTRRSLAVGAALVALLVCVPFLHFGLGGFLPGRISMPGSLQLLALCLVFGGVALSYDLLFGYTGLLSFGHALYFAVGVYVAGIALTRWHWGMWTTLALVLAVGIALPLALGAVSLRVGGIAFAMVTLAFAQAGAILVQKNPWKLTGGEEGLGLDFSKLPDFFVGVLNTKYLYWLALGYAVVVFAIVQWAVHSSPGRVWQAIRENELRVEVLGLRPRSHKLLAFVLASFLATAGGVVYLMLIGGATPEVTSANFTLTLLIMVVLGGAGTRYGALLGGALYTYLDNRLLDWSDSGAVQSLPAVLRTPLSEPLFVLGVVFVVLVLFLPGGLAGLSGHGRRRGLALLERTVRGRTAPVEEAGA
jgi:branched-chain amino acid transport system permease protein